MITCSGHLKTMEIEKKTQVAYQTGANTRTARNTSQIQTNVVETQA
jgi:hypothetical protein